MKAYTITGLLFLMCLLGAGSSSAQLSLTGSGVTATMNFNIPGTQNCTALNTWTDNSTIPNCYSDRTVYGYSNGCHNSGALHVEGTAAGETALGGRASNSVTSLKWGVRIANNTGVVITSLLIKYREEQWGLAEATLQQTVTFDYYVSPTPITSVSTGAYTAVSALDMVNLRNGAVNGSNMQAIDGNDPANSTIKQACITVNIPVGGEIMLRWNETNDPNNDHTMCVDDLEVTPLTSVKAVSNAPLCSGDTLKLTTTPKVTGGSYTWTGPNGFTAPVSDTFIVNARAKDTGYYKITTSVPGCGTFKDSVRVIVNPPYRDTTLQPIYICSGDKYTFNGKSHTTTGYYEDTFKSAGGCDSIWVTNLIVRPVPPPPTVNPDTIPTCQFYAAPQLKAVGTNLLWYTDITGGTGVPTAPIPSTDEPGTTTWYVTQTIDGCVSQRQPITVVVRSALAKFTLQPNPLCAGDTATITYTGNNPSEAVYNWVWDGAVIFSGSGQGPYKVTWVIPGTYSVKLQTLFDGCSSKIAEVTVKVNPLPIAGVAVPAEACQDAVVALSATGGISYKWSYGNGTAIGNTDGQKISVQWNTTGKKTIEVVATDANGCKSEPATGDIMINGLPDAKIITDLGGSVCASDTILLEAAAQPNYSYQWNTGYFPVDFPSDRIIHVYTISNTAPVYVTVTDDKNCSATDSVLLNIQPCCGVYMPNAFTPNLDGNNDLFRAITKAPQPVYDLRIFDRWGKQVYATNRYYDGWDGTVNGEPGQLGVYHYLLRFECDGREQVQKGEVTLIR